MSASQQKRNKRVLVLANFDVGLYKFRKDLLQAMLDTGFEVWISLPNGAFIPPLEAMGCRFVETAVDRRGMNPIRDLKLLGRYLDLLRQVQPDLVLTYTIKPNIYGGLACWLRRIPYAANITGLGSAIEGGGMVRKLVLVMYRMALKKAKTVFFENAGNCAHLLRAKVLKEAQAQVLPGAGINLADYPCQPYPGDGSVHFLFVGRIMKEKGVDELFEAAARIKKMDQEKVVFDLVGLFEESYEAKIRQLQEAGTVVFHGYQADVKPFYEAAHCVVLPSYHEGMSNVLLECAATGRPLITSRIHGCMEAVVEGKSGLLCEPKDADSLYAAMKQFLALPHQDRAAMGQAARAHMETVFDKKKVVEATMERLFDGVR